MSKIKVIIHGALGKMGQTTISAVSQEFDMELVAAVDKTSGSINLPDGSGRLKLYNDINRAIDECGGDVVVDFSLAQALPPLARCLLPRSISLVSGTTGLSHEAIGEIDGLSKKYATGVIIASNFSIGSIVMQHLVRIASNYFDNAEIIELHHDKKADAPSGTALTTASGMFQSRGKTFNRPDSNTNEPSRGLDASGIPIHSVRLPGVLASQDVIFGAPGQTLSISHNAISRDCYMPGVIMALRRVVSLKEMVFGLDKLIGL